jgi:hypothetical protein
MDTVPRQAVEFAGFVLMHCALIADNNRDGQLVCPFAVVEADGERLVIDFEADTQEAAIEQGWASLAHWKPSANGWAFGREGVYRSGASGVDVMVVTVWVRGMDAPASAIQKFGRDGEHALYLIGAPELIGHATETAHVVAGWQRADLLRGIALHPHGRRWAQWQPQ